MYDVIATYSFKDTSAFVLGCLAIPKALQLYPKAKITVILRRIRFAYIGIDDLKKAEETRKTVDRLIGGHDA